MSEITHRVVTIQNKKGLHARAAAKFVKTASEYAAEVTVTRLPKEASQPIDPEWVVSARSILGLMMLGAEPGADIRLEAHGEDAQPAIDALAGLVERRFDEGE